MQSGEQTMENNSLIVGPVLGKNFFVMKKTN